MANIRDVLEKPYIWLTCKVRQDRHCEGLGMTDPHRSEDREVKWWLWLVCQGAFPGPAWAWPDNQ